MAITNQLFQQIVLERLVDIEASVATSLELQALEGEACNVQLNLLMKTLTGTLTSDPPDIPQLSLTRKYQEFFDAHRDRITKEVVASLRDRSGDFEDSDGELQLIDILQ